jgi:hypothetical protein
MAFTSPSYSSHPHPSEINVFLCGYASFLYSASPQCANTKGPRNGLPARTSFIGDLRFRPVIRRTYCPSGERVRPSSSFMVYQGSYCPRPIYCLCTPHVLLPTLPEITRRTRSPRLSVSSKAWPRSVILRFRFNFIHSCRCGCSQDWHILRLGSAYQLNHQRSYAFFF